MESDSPSPRQDKDEQKAEFRKLTNDAANRKYRRRSPVSGSSSADGSPMREHSSSPASLKEDPKRSYYQRRKDDRQDDRRFERQDKGSSRSHYGGDHDSHGYSSRSHYSRRDDHSKHGKHEDETDRNYSKISSRLGRDSDYKERESGYSKSRDRLHDEDKYIRGESDAPHRRYREKDLSSDRAESYRRHSDRVRYRRDRDYRDEKRDHRRSPVDRRSDDKQRYEESRRLKDIMSSRWDYSKDMNGKEKDKKYDEQDRHEVPYGKGVRHSISTKNEESSGKRPKLFNLEDSTLKKDEREEAGSNQVQELGGKVPEHSTSNLDAAKFAAMRAAELVNQNLAGTGIMTADQKKKLLWGNKKNDNAEESSRHWNTALFSDREQKEKFNKLMGVKGDAKADPKPDARDAEKQKELQLDLEKQYTAGLRRRDGRTVGLGL